MINVTATNVYLLDTNVWVVHLRRQDRALSRRIADTRQDSIVLCSVVLAELYFGAIRSGPDREAENRAAIRELQRQFVSIPFDDGAVEYYAQLRANLSRLGMTIGPNDTLIAAIALANDLTLVTHNTAEFSRVPGLTIEDWQTT